MFRFIKVVFLVSSILLLNACGGGGNTSTETNTSKPNTPNTISMPTVEDALNSGNVSKVTVDELIKATLKEIEVNKSYLLDAKIKIFNLNSDGTAKSDSSSLTSINWDPSHDASLFVSTLGKNISFLNTNAVAKVDKTVYNKEIGIIGEKGLGRYMVLGGNPFRTIGNEQMEKVLENSLSWLTSRDNLKTAPFSVVISHLDDSYWFRDESKTREWLDTHYATKITYNTADSCDNTALAGCLSSKPNLLIISQISEDSDDKKAIASTVNQALADGISVLYIHHDGDLKVLGKELFSSVFDVTYEWDNYWKKLSLVDFNPLNNFNVLSSDLQKVKTLFTHLRDGDYNFNWGLCEDSKGIQSATNDKCDNVVGLNSEFLEGATIVKSMMNSLDSNKKNIFAKEGYRVQKLLALTGDKLRQEVTYPMDKVKTDDNKFMRSFYADHAVYNYRAINPTQLDMGNFSRSDFSHITPTTKTVNLISKKNFRATGLYAIPAKTVKIRRTDRSEVGVKVFINTLRSGATHQYEEDGYKRPKYLQSPYFEISSNKTIEFTSPYGGTIQLEFDTNDKNVSLRFENVGEHAFWASSADDSSFTSKLASNEFDWAEVVTTGFEVHSKLDKMVKSISDPKWGTAEALASATARYMSSFPHVLAGFKGKGIDAVAEIYDFATKYNLTIQELDLVKHMNADQATCGYGCSGNPYDAYWAYSPIGHGDVHELGHGLEKSRFQFEDFERHAITNPYSYYTKSKYNETTGGDPDCQKLPFKEVYEKLQASVGESNSTAYLKTNLWATSSWSQQVLVTIQAMMHTQKMGKLANGWHLLARLHILEREIKKAKEDWDNKKVSLGFSSYTLDEFNAMRKNDWLLVSLSFAGEVDFRDYLSMMGIEYSTKASAQVASFGYPLVPKKFFVSTPSGYCKSDDTYGAFLDKSSLDVDGTTLFPY